MEMVLEFLRDVLSQPALLIGIMSCVGLVALKRPFHKVMTGTLKPILGYLMLAAGAGVIVSNLDPLGKMIEHGFHITGVVPNNEAIVAVAQKVLGVETMSILVVGLLMNLCIARFTKFKYVFLTGHHSLFMACLMSAVLGIAGLSGMELILVGGFLMGAWSAISPAIGQSYTSKVTDGDEIALGHFGSLGYYLSAWVAKYVGKADDSTEDIEIPEKWGFLRDSTLSTALTMIVFYLIAAFAAGVLAGIVTGLLQTKLKVHPVLAGIITMSGLYSINLMVRGSSNLNFNDNSAFTKFYKAVGISGADKKIAGLVIGAVICILVLILLIVFFRTHLGLCIRATGDNPDMVRASSINVDFSLIFGLALANGLIALSGALISHYLGLSDQSFSNGTLIYGLAAVIIGEAIFGKRNVALGLTSAVVGSVIYKIIVAFVIDVSLFGKNSENLMKLTCAIIVAATLIVPEIKHKIENAKAKKEARKNA